MSIFDKEVLLYKMIKLKKKTVNKKCLYFGCSGPAIKAHSIQKEKVLSKLAENGKVMVLDIPKNIITMEPKGKMQASIFTGMCSKHDGEVFKAIDTQDYDIKNKEQEILFAYRAFVRELHTKKSSRNTSLALVISFHEFGITNIESIQARTEGLSWALRDLDAYSSYFQSCIQKDGCKKLFTYHIQFETEFGIAVSSAISFPHDFLGNRLGHLDYDLGTRSKPLFVTIFPQSGKTNVLLSMFDEDAGFYSFIENQLIQKSQDKQKQLLTNLIVENCENLALSPKYWNRLSDKTKDSILSAYLRNIGKDFDPSSLVTKRNFNFFLNL